MMKYYLCLAVAIFGEVIATSLLKIANGFDNILAIVSSILCYLVSFYFLGLSLKKIPLSIAYAIWSGCGTVLTMFLSVLIWDELLTGLKITATILIISGVVLLNLSEDEKSES